MDAMASDGSSRRDAVRVAVDLGWRLAELYDRKNLPGPPDHPKPTPIPPHLPGFGEMTSHEQACALAAHVTAELPFLGTALRIDMPTMEGVQAALSVAGHGDNEVRKELLGAYIEVRDRLAGSDPVVALGFGLGRMLADTALLPTSDRPGVLWERFESYRLANAFDWLDDLDAILPTHSASAVRASLSA
jgi:hypothetical protein